MAKKTGAISPEQQSKAALLKRVKSSDIDEVTLSDCVGLFVEVDRAIARKQDTSSAILERLSHHSDKIVRQAVASHHNISSEDLMRLGKQFPDAFLSNPALDLILIENPGILLNFDESLLVQIAKREACPEAFLKWAMRHGSEQVLMAIAMNPSTPVELLQQLSVSEFSTVKEAVRFHTKLLDGMEVSDIQAHFKQAVIERLSVLSAGDAYQMWKRKEISLVHFCYLSVSARLLIANGKDISRVAYNLNTPAWILAELLKVKRYREAIAWNPNAPKASLVSLATDTNWLASKEWLTRYDLSMYPGTPIEWLSVLANDNNESVREGVAENPTTPIELLYSLAKDANFQVRNAIAKNPNTPIELLSSLAKDKDHSVRGAVAGNLNTPIEELLSSLAEDKAKWVRRGVAGNPNTPIELLSSLAKDSDDSVRRGVAGNPNAPINLLALLAEDKDDDVRESVARNPNTLVESLTLLANDKNNRVRETVAGNPNTPMELLSSFAKDKDNSVRFRVAHNPSAPFESLKLLAKDKKNDVRYGVAGNPNTPIELLNLLAKDGSYDRSSFFSVREAVAENPNASIELLNLLAQDCSYNARRGVAGNPNAPIELLNLLAQDWSCDGKYVREAVAANPNTPIELLSLLVGDISTAVRHAASNNPKNRDAIKAMLEKLKAHPKSKKVRNLDAINPQCPVELLMQLCYDKNMPITVKEWALETLHLTEDTLSISHFYSILKTKPIPEQVLVRLGKHKNRDLSLAALCNPLHPNFTKSLIEAPITNPLFIKWVSKAQQSAQSALESGNVFFFAGKEANKTAVSKSALARVFAISDGASVEPALLAKSQKHNDWLVRMSIASNIGTPINALNKLKQDSHALVAKQAEMTIAKLSEKPESELLSEKARQSCFSDLAKDIAVTIKSKHHQIVAIDDPVWGECINSTILWDPSRIHEVTETWTDAEWKLFGKWILPLEPEALAPYLTSETIVAFAVKYLKRKKASLAYLASHPLCSEVSLKLLAEDKNDWVRKTAADNTNTPVESLFSLAKDEDDSVRRAAADNTNTPIESLYSLTKDEDYWVRSAVAGNTNTPVDSLSLLAMDKYQLVREAVAGNPNTPIELLPSLANELVSIRRAVAGNPNASVDLLSLLAKDKDKYKDKLVREAVAGNPNTPSELLKLLAEDEYYRVRKSIAENPNTPVESLLLLVKDENNWVRKSVAGNPNTPTELLSALAKDKDDSVRRGVADNPKTPKNKLETTSSNKYAFLQSLYLAEYKEHIRIALSPDIPLPRDITTLDIRRGVESLGLIKEEISNKELTEMRISKDRLQRVAVCFHDKVTENLLSILSEDKDVAVAEIAKEKLAVLNKKSGVGAR